MTHADMIVTDVDSVTVRDVAGEGSQAALILRVGRASLVIRLVARRGQVLRLTDLRRRDRTKRAQKNLVTVPMEEIR